MSLSRALPSNTDSCRLLVNSAGHFVQTASTSPAASILEEDPALICLRARADADIEAARHLHRVALVQGSGYRVLERTRARIASRLGNARRAHAIVSSPSELRARTRVRRCTPGARTERESPLTREDLWLTEERLPAADNVLPEHECGLCHSLKSHPVHYTCGHGHCYVCIRVWLEGSWECPDEFCGLVMRRAPAQDVDAADVIADTYPECIDSSSVDYSWEGLVFPQRRPRAQRAGFM